MVTWAHPNPQPILHLDRFCRFCSPWPSFCAHTQTHRVRSQHNRWAIGNILCSAFTTNHFTAIIQINLSYLAEDCVATSFTAQTSMLMATIAFELERDDRVLLNGITNLITVQSPKREITTIQHLFNGLYSGQSGEAGTRKANHSGSYWRRSDGVAMASAGPCASHLHLSPDR